jgi:prepilin-type processing-associated H-X9-DG protein
MKTTHHDCASRQAFTRIDALATGCALTLLGGLLLPALANTQLQSRNALCAGNLNRLQRAWTQFATDNDGLLPRSTGASVNWVSGIMDSANSADNTNTLNLLDPRYAQLGPYTGDARLYRCPADPSRVPMGPVVDGLPTLVPRVRSYSISGAMAGDGSLWIDMSFFTFMRIHDIVNPAPSEALVFVDEHPGSINDGSFAIQAPSRGNLVDVPASHHDRAGTVSFADGHTELHAWQDDRTMPAFRGISIRLNFPTPGNPDLEWLVARASSRR